MLEGERSPDGSPYHPLSGGLPRSAVERLAYDDFEVVLERVAAGLTARVSSSPVGPTPPEPVVMPGVDVDGRRELVRLMN